MLGVAAWLSVSEKGCPTARRGGSLLLWAISVRSAVAAKMQDCTSDLAVTVFWVAGTNHSPYCLWTHQAYYCLFYYVFRPQIMADTALTRVVRNTPKPSQVYPNLIAYTLTPNANITIMNAKT